jgi:hypothetical protein
LRPAGETAESISDQGTVHVAACPDFKASAQTGGC